MREKYTLKEVLKREDKAQKQHGFNYINPEEYVQDMLHQLEKARMIKSSDKILPNGFTKDFYDFLRRNTHNLLLFPEITLQYYQYHQLF